MLDISYEIPIDIRDTALKMAGLDKLILKGSDCSKNREVKAIIAEKQEAKFNKEKRMDTDEDDKQLMARDLLMKLATKLKGKAPTTASTSKSKIPNTGDLSRLVKKLPFSNSISIPTSQPDLRSFFIFGIASDLPQYAILNYAKQYGGTLASSTINHKAKCGFISFNDRDTAEKFANHILTNKLNINNNNAGLIILHGKFPVRVTWGNPVDLGIDSETHTNISHVVNKVMKQLADKDKSGTPKSVSEPSATPKHKHTTNTKSKKANKIVKPAHKSTEPVKKYTALSPDFEA
jgi:pre-mRNA-splicing factor RBM22/SLT11